MSNSKYTQTKVDEKTGALNVTSETLQAVLVSSGYTFSAAHTAATSVTNQLGSPVTLGTVTVDASGVAQMSGSITVGAGQATAAVAVVILRGTGGTAKPLVYLDDPDGGASSFSLVPGAGGLSLSFPSGFLS